MLIRPLAWRRHGSYALLLLAFSCGSDGGTGPSPDPATCDDGARNGTETDVDCGGDGCEPCARGSLCDADDDCETGSCRANRCVSPPSCSDGVRNNGETGIDCGGPECDECEVGGPCNRSSDCESSLCVAGRCAPAECGDGVLQEDNDEECDDRVASAECNADCTLSACGDGILNTAAGEECDDSGETAECNVDCTLSACGDGVLNTTAGEECEPGAPRCLANCRWGLDGTFGDEWERLADPPTELPSLPSFHYADTPYLYDFRANMRYDLEADEWQPLQETFPVPGDNYWTNGAVARDGLFVPRQGRMYFWSFEDELWSAVAEDIPSGSPARGAAVFDNDGQIWYHGPESPDSPSEGLLVRFSPDTGDYTLFPHPYGVPLETRVAYDPLTNRIAFGGHSSTSLVIFDIADEEFTTSPPNPGGLLHNNSCQDRAGGMYAGSTDFMAMYRFDFVEETWTELPPLPAPHDNYSSCVVSSDGYLYYASREYGFWRLPLGRYQPAQ
ncbi:MAG: hypothetical protein GX607_18970 [Myxococcales bacterium]|nr:hypothetical protein [Myxococcales bacterium]